MGWLQIVIFIVIVLALVKPLGTYLFRVYESPTPPLASSLGRVERLMNRLTGVDATREQTWKEYTLAVLAFSLFGLVVTYLIQRLQAYLPLNPQHLDNVEPSLAFNTSASFTTNTNWQSYAGETTMSYLTQMAGLA
jgi:K+-transporting ATPase ATPase A chain